MILGIMSVYNEEYFLPFKIEWCRSNGISLFVLDNMSTDSTVEILEHNNVQYIQYNTDGVFSESLMQDAIKSVLDSINPEWVVYMGCDLFFSTLFPIREIMEHCNVITLPFYSARNTGEERSSNPFKTYRHVNFDGELDFIFKYDKDIIFNGDEIIFPYEVKRSNPDGIWINYGDTKTSAQRLETLERREKAWDKGENENWGNHLISGYNKNWLWDKSELHNIDDIDLTSYIDKLQFDCGL